MAKLASELVLSLTDHVSGPSRQINQNLDNLRRQQMRSQEMFNQHRNAMLGTAAAAYVMARAIAVPIQASIEFSTQLEDIRQKADMSTEAIERLGRKSREVGKETGQGAGSITGAIDSMVGSGAVTPEQATDISLPLGKAATAYGADPTDLANASSAMVLQLGLGANELEKAYDMMAVGGKQGSFELKDMAAEFPGVLANAKSLGMEGEKGLASVVAWLQISRRGTADASSAATNFSEFMGKIMSQNAIKNFGEAGVDIVNEMARATEAGVDPIEHAIGIINGLTDGQRAKMGELFADKQVTDFLLQATKAVEDYRKIRDEALAADGTVEADFQARLATPAGAIARFEASIENLNIAVGDSLVPALANFARSVTPMIDGVASFVDANGELVAAVVEITAALVGLRLLAAGGGMASALFGLGGGKGGGAGGALGSAARTGVSSAGGGRNGGNFAKYGFMAFNGLSVAQDFLSQKDSMTVRQPGQSDEDWAAQVKPGMDALAAQNAAIEQSLLGFDINGFKPFEVLKNIQNPVGGIGGGYTGATAGQIEAMKAEISKLDAEILEWPEDGMAERRAGLQETLNKMQADFAASSGTLSAEMASIMERLRIMAAAGVNIPVNVNGPLALPGPSRMIDAPGNFSPPSMPTRATGGGGGAGPTSVTVGDVYVQNPTNANPKQIASLMGDEVGKRVRAAHSNGAYG